MIGLDGTPFSFLRSEIEAGNLPHIARLAGSGALTRMESEIPTISSVAWASFMTGKNPGEHGIFGFTDRKPGTYELFFPNYSHLAAEPLWERLSREGKRCCVLNVPSSYPARPLNGILVSGFVAPSLARAVYPSSAYDYLESLGYRIDVDASKARESLDLLLEDLYDVLNKRREAMLHFWETEQWDFFMSVFTGTDRLHHFMWRHFVEGDPVYQPEFRRYYQKLDEIIGEFVAGLEDDTALFMLSDHGFCGIEKEVYLNTLLRERGFISFRTETPQTIADIDPEKTSAYCLDPGRIYLNIEGREAAGVIKPEAAAGLSDELVELLGGLEDPETGAKMVDRVERGEDLYSGPQAGRGPDLVVVPVDGYDFKGSVSSPEWIGRSHLEGMHTRDDAFIYLDEPIRDNKPHHIRDVAPLVLGCFEVS